jgi:hypothetical protein
MYPKSLTDSKEITSKKGFVSNGTAGEAVRVVLLLPINI